MIEATSTPLSKAQLLQHSAIKSNIYILFLEFEGVETDSIISLLRDIKLAPRGHTIA